MSGIHYGKPYARCTYCGKWVKLAGFLAGIHLCLTPEEIAAIDRRRRGK